MQIKTVYYIEYSQEDLKYKIRYKKIAKDDIEEYRTLDLQKVIFTDAREVVKFCKSINHNLDILRSAANE